MTDYAPFDGRRRTFPAPVLIEQLWTLRNEQGGRLLTAGLFTHPYGTEVRCSLGDDRNLLKSQVCKTVAEARELAAEWKAQSLAHGYGEVMGGE